MFFNIINIFLLVQLFSIKNVDGRCMWYGICGKNPDLPFPKDLNCYYDGDPRTDPNFDYDTLKEFKKLCPEYFDSDGQPIPTCCDSRQVINMINGAKNIEPLLAGCPSCWRNFRNYMCGLNCDPDNHSFVRATEFIPYITPFINLTAIKSVELYMSNTLASGIFDSCSNVVVPYTGEKVIGFICGNHGSSGCTPQYLFSYLGDIESGFVFFTVVPVLDNSYNPKYDMTPLNTSTFTCDQAPSETELTCSCIDCPASCI